MKKITHFLLLTLLFVLSLNGMVAGVMMIASPDGSWLQMNADWLQRTPFSNYLVPGIILFLFLGSLPAISFLGLLMKPQWNWPVKINLLPGRSWGNTFALYSGVTGIIWISVQQLITFYFVLQPVILLLSVSIIVLALLEDR